MTTCRQPSFFLYRYPAILIQMSPESTDKKNTLQDVVDGIQTQENPFGKEPAKGYVPNPDLKSLRTFQGDMQEHIEVKKETVATIALAEQKKKIEHNEPTYTEPEVRSKKTGSRGGLFVIFGILALIIGGVISGVMYFLQTETDTTLAPTIEKTLISYTDKKEVMLPTISAQTLASSLLQEKATYQAAANSVLYLRFSQGGTAVLNTTLFDTIAVHAGDALKRNIEDGMVGIYSLDTTELFFILKPDDFGIVYSGMLEWESTLGSDMSLFFPLLQKHLESNPSVFTDETYKNKDVRVIRNENGALVLLYGFIDKDTLVITANEKIFEAILNRYLQSKLSR